MKQCQVLWDTKFVFPSCLVFLESVKRRRMKKRRCRKRRIKRGDRRENKDVIFCGILRLFFQVV